MIRIFERYNQISDVKDIIFATAIETANIELVKFFLKKNYNIYGKDILFLASYEPEIFDLFIKKGMKIDEWWRNVKNDYGSHQKSRFKDLDFQKKLIDLGYDQLIYDEIGFNYALEKDPKYKDVVDRFEVTGKYNL